MEEVIDQTGQHTCNLLISKPIITFINKPDPLAAISLKTDMILEVKVFQPTGTLTLEWKGLDIASQRLLSSTDTRRTILTIQSRNLEQNIQYNLAVTAVFQGSSTTETVSFRTASMIKPGQVRITPSEGFFFETEFTVNFSGWQASSSDAVRISIVAFIQEADSTRRSQRSLASGIDPQNTTAFKFKIPTGTASTIYTVETIGRTSHDIV